eukprot:4174208-Alexandrium_andersonii.AAC.1
MANRRTVPRSRRNLPHDQSRDNTRSPHFAANRPQLPRAVASRIEKLPLRPPSGATQGNCFERSSGR